MGSSSNVSDRRSRERQGMASPPRVAAHAPAGSRDLQRPGTARTESAETAALRMLATSRRPEVAPREQRAAEPATTRGPLRLLGALFTGRRRHLI